MDSLVLTPLNSIETHLNALITSLTQTNTFTNAPQTAKDLLADDDDLAAALALLQRHQQNYAHILNLRAEVATLQEQLKDTIRKCVSFKQEIGQINPSILDSDSEDEDEDEGEANVAEVDYHTLLTFAARIGRHNTLAAKEAEAEAVRRKIAAKNAPTTITAVANGISASITAPADSIDPNINIQTAPATDATNTADTENNTAETTAELQRIDNAIALQRAQMGMSFPDAASLRAGALGQLQLFMERQRQQFSGGVGREEEVERNVQEAVDREVERMVRESEDIAPEERREEEEITAFPESPVMARHSAAERESQTSASARQSSTSQGQAQAQDQRAPKPPQPKRKLDLDFPGSDDEDED